MTDQTPNRGAYVSADDFLNDRRDWLSVHAVEVQPGAFDIVLKLDGTYFDRDTAREVAESFAHDLECLLANLDENRFLVPPGTVHSLDAARTPRFADMAEVFRQRNADRPDGAA